MNGAARYQNSSLNENLIKGPDHEGDLIGVLLHFHQFKVAYMADIKSMYLQCRVTADDQQSLQFLWFQDGDSRQEIIDLHMTSQAFGVTSSGGNAGYLLWCMALNNHTHSSKAMTKTVRNNVYVNDTQNFKVLSVSTSTV